MDSERSFNTLRVQSSINYIGESLFKWELEASLSFINRLRERFSCEDQRKTNEESQKKRPYKISIYKHYQTFRRMRK